MTPADDHEVINPPHKLAAKVDTGGPGAVTPEVLEQAEQVIVGMTDNYLEWVERDLESLDVAFRKLEAEPDKADEHVKAIFGISHDVKGQGGSFGYLLMTAIGNELCRFIEAREESIGPGDVEVIRLHIDAMKVVIGDRLRGDGGDRGESLLIGLQQVIDKVTKG